MGDTQIEARRKRQTKNEREMAERLTRLGLEPGELSYWSFGKAVGFENGFMLEHLVVRGTMQMAQRARGLMKDVTERNLGNTGDCAREPRHTLGSAGPDARSGCHQAQA